MTLPLPKRLRAGRLTPAQTVRQAGRSSPKERMSMELKETTLALKFSLSFFNLPRFITFATYFFNSMTTENLKDLKARVAALRRYL
jgi:hypothetical protein